LEDKNYLNELFSRYLNNECSEKELEVLLQYFGSEANEDNLRLLVRKQLETFDHNSNLPSDVQGVLQEAYKNIAKETFLKNKKEVKVVLFNWSIFIKLTACACVLILVGVLYFEYMGQQLKHNYRQAITLNGERKQLQLADGTKIWLAPGSTLDYAIKFTGKTREVKLEGEAFFEVAHDKQHPFIIHTDKLNTTVYGTTFNVQAYPERATVEVALLSGMVGITEQGKQANQIMLAPNQRAVFNKTNEHLNKEDYPAAASMLARRDGKFIYKGIALSNVINDISKAYNVTIVLGKEMQDLSYYGEFDQKENLRQVLMQISLATNVKLVNKGAIWELHK
jgi:transmembrane sensor